ncbi:VPS35 endosomal protein sorting factor-like, partial [Gonapodya sp. JEL0774]
MHICCNEAVLKQSPLPTLQKTGGASGIGRATAVELSRHGARVIVGDLPTARTRFETFVGVESEIEYLEMDVSKEEDWSRVLKHVEDKYGGLDVLVNNAGKTNSQFLARSTWWSIFIQPPLGISCVGIYLHDDKGIYSLPEPALEEQSLEYWQNHFRVNVDGVFLGTREGVKLMKKTQSSESRSIINMSSITGIVGMASVPCYSATKGAVRLFTKSVALHCAQNDMNIRVNTVHPGLIDVSDDKMDVFGTQSFAAYKRATVAIASKQTPIGRAGTPLDVANAVLFLA